MTHLVPASFPYVTVLMSCYNAVRWLDQAIQSVLQQTYPDFEFIIVNDGSSDETLAVIQRFAAIDKRIVVIDKPNSGLADSLNVGISRARGAWIARLDADDTCVPDRLEKQVAKIMSRIDVVFVGSSAVLANEDGVEGKTYRYPLTHDGLVKNLITSSKFPPHSSAFYKADVVKKLGGYRTRFVRAQDCDLWLRLSSVGRLTAVDEVLVTIRKHSGQISHYESGRRQVIDSKTAIIGHFLRHMKTLDPTSAEDHIFLEFRQWVGYTLDKKGYFFFLRLRAHVKLMLATRHLTLRDIKVILVSFFAARRIIFYKITGIFRGESLWYFMAHEWKKSQARLSR